MTTAQKKGTTILLAFASMALTVAFSAGLARRELDAKEDREAHAVDVRALKTDLLEEQQRRALQTVRDSAQMSKVLDRITDLSCDRNPRRSYCSGPR